MKNIKYNKEDLIEAVKHSNTYVDVFRYLKLCTTNYNFLKQKLKEYNIDVSHFNQSKSRKGKVKRTLDELLQLNSEVKSMSSLKKKLYETGLKKRICEECGQDEEWRGKKISLILDHINGNRYDNRLENLRTLCPNCNASLDTHCGKNKKPKIEIEGIITPFQLKIKDKVNIIKDNNIDFTKRGWRLKIASLINIQPQRADKFIKLYIPEEYNNLYKHKDRK